MDQLFCLLGTAFADADRLLPITFPTDELRGFATGRDDDIRLFVLNRGDTARELTLPKSMNGNLLRMTIDARPNRNLPLSTSLAETSMVDERITLPAYSISLIGKRETLEFTPPLSADDNLFSRRPDLQFWYPPYASEQPRFDPRGVYTVDLSKCKDKSVAVLKMNLASSELSTTQEYTVAFEVKSSTAGGLIVKLPKTDNAQGEYSILGRNVNGLRYTFKFDPASNEGEVSFVFAGDLIAQGPTIEFRNFRISPNNPR